MRNPAAKNSGKPIVVGGRHLSVEEVCAVSRGAALLLAGEAAFRGRIERGAKVLADALASGRMVYGVNTGYGDSCTVEIPADVVEQLPAHLVRYHGCGLGDYFDEPTTVAGSNNHPHHHPQRHHPIHNKPLLPNHPWPWPTS